MIAAGIVAAAWAGVVQQATAAEREFLVMLATSPKHYAYINDGDPLPEGGLINPEYIQRQYFDEVNPQVGSFAEYWEEISYGDVAITGTVTDWIALPWSFEPRDASPESWYDMQGGSYVYGQGESFNPYRAMVVVDYNGDAPGPSSTDGFGATSSGGMGAGHPVWTPGERFVDVDGDGRWDGLDEANNWMDWDGDGKPDLDGPWYDLNGDNIGQNSTNCLYLEDNDNDGNPDCCPNGPGGPGCGGLGIDTIGVCPATTWTGPSGEVTDCNGNLKDDAQEIRDDPTLDQLPYESRDGQCLPGEGNGVLDICEYTSLTPCVADTPDPEDPCALAGIVLECVERTPPIELRQRCEFVDADGDNQLDVVEPFENFLRRWDPCLSDPDATIGTQWVKVYDPHSPTAGTMPIQLDATQVGPCRQPFDGKVTYTYDYSETTYVDVHYPSSPSFVTAQTDVHAVYGKHDPLGKLGGCTCANGDPCDPNDECPVGVHIEYNPPDQWTDAESTKLIVSGWVTSTPEPGTFQPHVDAGEESWFDDMWQDRYSTGLLPSTTPAWPNAWQSPEDGGSPPPGYPHEGAPITNQPYFEELISHDPEDPYDPDADRRYFQANAGGTSSGGSSIWSTKFNLATLRDGGGRGWKGSGYASYAFDLGVSDLMGEQILPEERDGIGSPIFYDGWVEHDDLPSSKYHLKGDQRFGEVTSPWSDSYYGEDRGTHNPDGYPTADRHTVAAGPYAVNIHGEFGRDAGNVAMTEMLTWRWWKRSRNDGPSFGGSWEKVYHTSHPFAGPGSFMAPNENLGFLDYNLDGLLDQGEVRVAGSENYMLDHTTATLPNGTNSLYPWNRRRLMEDVIEVLDEVVDFNDYVDLQGKQAHECNHGELIKAVPRVLAGATGVTVTPQGVVSGIVLLPYQAYSDSRAYFGGFAEQPVQQPPEPTLNSTTYYYPIHNEDNDDFSKSFPPDTTVPPQRQQVHWNAFFSDVVVRLATAGDYFGNPQPAAGDTMRDSMRMRTAYAAHDYLHIWEGFFDLFDYDALQSSGIPINTPIGQWDIMAGQMDSWLFGGRVPLNLVHSIPVLKAKPCTEWTDPIDLATVLTPGADTVLTLPPSELARDESYFFVENERFPDDGSSRIERLYLYSAGGLTDTLHFDQPLFPGFTSPVLVRDGMPASGLLILHTDQDANSDALPPQQRTGTHFTYQIVEADGDGELAAGIPPYGDAGDPWPGNTQNTTFDFSTSPASRWYTQNSFTGLQIKDIEPDGQGAIRLTLNWVPPTIPGLSFTTPPGGTSVYVPGPPAVELYQVHVETTDIYGETWVRWFYTTDETDLTIDPDGANYVGIAKTENPGTHGLSVDWNITDVDDDRYFLFAQLAPEQRDYWGAGQGPEQQYTQPRAGRNNAGDGTFSVDYVGVAEMVGSGGNGIFYSPTVFVARDDAGQNVNMSSHAQAGDQITFAGLLQPPPPNGDGIDDRQPVLATIANVRTMDLPEPFKQGSALLTPVIELESAVDRGVSLTEVDEWQVTSTPSATARFETWYVTCVNAAGTDWQVFSSLTQPEPADTDPNQDPYAHATTGVQYTSLGGEVKFTITEGTTPFALGDTFVFSTTGMTEVSKAVTVMNGQVSEGPTAVIFAQPLSGVAPLTVSFDGRDSFDPNGQALTFRWTFGDGTAAVTGPKTVSHTYQDSGTYTATLRVTNPNTVPALFGEASVDVVVINNSPSAKIYAQPTSGPLDPVFDVDFSGADSSDVETPADELIYQWNFGDGETANDAGVAGPSFIEVAHAYSQAGSYVATLTVTDAGGKTDTDTVTILAGNTNPTPQVFHTGLTGADPHTVTFNARNSTDADGDSLTVEWHWGDGSSNETYAATVGKSGDGSVPHTFNLPSGQDEATFRVTAVVRDARGGSTAWQGVTVRVTDAETGSSLPMAIFSITPDPPVVGEAFTADGHLSYDRPAGSLLDSYTWSFGDGTVITGPDSLVTHTYTQAGTYTIQLTVADAETPPNTHTAQLVVVVTGEGGEEPPSSDNQRPTARVVADPLEGVAGETVFSFDGSQSTDPDEGDVLTYEWTLGDGSTSTETALTHVFASSGTYTVRLRVRDQDNASSLATAVIRVYEPGTNQAPSAFIATGPRTGTAPVTLTFNGSTSFDPDEDPLTYRWEFRLNGILVGTASAAIVQQRFETAGTYTMTLAVSDGRGGSDTAGPEFVTIAERTVTPNDNGNANDNTDPNAGQDITDSAAQRPTGSMCGLGMLMSFFASLVGWTLMAARRRRFRW